MSARGKANRAVCVHFGGDSDGKEVRLTRAKVFGDCVYARELYLDAFNELIRQITIDSPERGILLARLRDQTQENIRSYEE